MSRYIYILENVCLRAGEGIGGECFGELGIVMKELDMGGGMGVLGMVYDRIGYGFLRN